MGAQAARLLSCGPSNVSRQATSYSTTAYKDFLKLLWWHHLELCKRAITRRLVFAPATKLRRVAEATPLHVIVRNFQHQLWAQRFPRKILSLTPTTLRAGNATARFTFGGDIFGPLFPWVAHQRITTIGRKKLD